MTQRVEGTRLLHKALLIAAGILCSLVLLEAGLRCSGFVLSSAQNWGNARAMRKEGVYRILCLGESTTARYPGFLQEALDASGSGIRFCVINKGIPAINSSYIVSNLESWLEEYRPNMVITMMGINDDPSRGRRWARENPGFWGSLRIGRLFTLIRLHCSARFARDDGAYIRLGKMSRERGALAEAEKAYTRALKRDPRNEKLRADLAEVYEGEGKYLREVETYEEGLALDPQNYFLLIRSAAAYIRHDKPQKAEAALKKALALKPRADLAYIDLGMAYRMQARFSEAESAYQTALSLNPLNCRVYYELAEVLRDEGRPADAEAAYKKALEFEPAYGDACLRLGSLLEGQGRFPEAEAVYKRISGTKGDDPRVRLPLSGLYRKMGDEKRAGEIERQGREPALGERTIRNYRRLKEVLEKRGIQYVCMQYPLRDLAQLKGIFRDDPRGILFVDNEEIFREAVRKRGYDAYFQDTFAGDFGHCTDTGEKLLTGHLAQVLISGVFKKR